MNAIWIIAEREVRGFFSTSLAYVLLVVWLVYQGLVFTYAFQSSVQQGFSPGQGESPITFVLGGWIFFYIIIVAIVPALTMRFVAEEYRSGNIESVLSTPNDELALVLGKFLAGLIIWIALWLPTLIYVWLTSRFGSLDLGATLSSYIGVLGVGAHYIAIGVFASTVARTPLAAFLIGFMLLTMLFILGIGAMIVGEGTLGEIAGYISIWEHMSTFGRGIVDTRYLMFDLTMTVLPLFVAHRILVARRLA
jgi:ABC-2 type transport system permease protein